jgi:DNA repair exonuclease SbcCD ATPase subunit
MAESETKKKLKEMTRKFDDMRMKYDSLQELAQKAADTNFDKLKKASDEKTKGEMVQASNIEPPTNQVADANNLISSLKREIAELRNSSSLATSESARLQSKVASLQTSQEKAVEEAKSTSAALLEAQNEVKSLTAKLDAARKANQAPTVEKVPGSAMKSGPRGQIGGSGPEATKEAKLKEELYRDLTGLIINSVKRRDGEDEYSCIQTGRNGSEFSPVSSPGLCKLLTKSQLFTSILLSVMTALCRTPKPRLD